jgi:thymidylate kinase
MIALVGADGSGKSTVARDLRCWLAWKVDVVPVYFGSGAGPKSLPRHLLVLTQKVGTLFRRTTGRRGGITAHGGDRIVRHAPESGVRSGLRTLLRAWWALSLAHEKHVRITRARRARDRGAIVICDRFPQSQVAGVNDGPLLVDWAAHASWLKRLAADRELAVYDELRRCPPDLVVKLHASPDVARRRKPDTGMEVLRQKSQVVRDLKYPPAVQVVEVDADGAYEDVLREVKRMIWEVL